MGLFDGLISSAKKKQAEVSGGDGAPASPVCGICGSALGFGRASSVADGKICSSCKKKLSPYFENRRKSTLAQIRRQIEYREENEEALKRFKPTRSIGELYRVLIDEDSGKFVVVDDGDWRSGNPDLIDAAKVMDVIVRAGEDYDYDVFCSIVVDSPYFNEITVVLFSDGDSAKKGRSPEYLAHVAMVEDLREFLLETGRERRSSGIAQVVKCQNCGASTVPNDRNQCEYCGGPVG